MNMIEVEGKKINITHPDKPLWKEAGIRKIDYIVTMIELAPYLLPHTKDKPLTVIRYPHGVGDKSFYQKRPPKGTPDWVDIVTTEGDDFIHLNSLPTLVWLANSAALEFHTPFSKIGGMLTSLVFDLDPSEGQTFEDVTNCALKVYETLKSLGVSCRAKTSGASGLQIYVPTRHVTYEQGRKINTFFAQYFTQKFPELMTIERQVKDRGKKLYFDYLQMHPGKNIVSVYSPRAVSCAAISMPVSWQELEKGIDPCDFNLKTAVERLEQKGDMFAHLLQEGESNNALEEILAH